jgi:hypothetical protein
MRRRKTSRQVVSRPVPTDIPDMVETVEERREKLMVMTATGERGEMRIGSPVSGIGIGMVVIAVIAVTVAIGEDVVGIGVSAVVVDEVGGDRITIPEIHGICLATLFKGKVI